MLLARPIRLGCISSTTLGRRRGSVVPRDTILTTAGSLLEPLERTVHLRQRGGELHPER
jgi:hypothetical protein